MISIRPDQIAALKQDRFRRFATEMLPTVRKAWPLLDDETDAQVLERIMRAAEHADAYGVVDAPSVLAVLNVFIVLGEDFASDGRLAAALRLPPAHRLRRIRSFLLATPP